MIDVNEFIKNNSEDRSFDEDIKAMLSEKNYADYIELRGTEEGDRIMLWKLTDAMYEAHNTLPIEFAREAFASKNLTDLIAIIEFTEFLKENEIKLLSKKELENDTEAFLGELFKHRDFIIRRGLKTEDFYNNTNNNTTFAEDSDWDGYGDCKWELDWDSDIGYSFLRDELTNLYCLDIAFGLDFADPIKNKLIDKYLVERFFEGKKISQLKDKQIIKIENDRPKLLDLKINIVQELLSSIKKPTDDVTWVKCLKLMAEKLDLCDLDFYNEVESLYNCHVSSGGIARLFNVIEYYEIESKFGIFSKMRDALGDLVTVVGEESRHLSVFTYVEAILKFKEERIKNAFEIYLSCRSEMEKFLEEYHRDVEQFIIKGFKERVVFEVAVDSELAGGIQKQGDGFLEYMKKQSEIAGRVPLVSYILHDPEHTVKYSTDMQEKPAKEEVPALCFYKDGESWMVGELGHEKRFSHSVGMERLHYLLSDPEEPFPANTVLNLGKINPPQDMETPLNKINPEKLAKILEEHGLSLSHDEINRDVFDRGVVESAMEKYIEEIKERKEERQDSGSIYASSHSDFKNPQDALEEDQDTDNLVNRCDKSSQKKETKYSDNIRTRVSKSIWGAHKEIIKAIPEMGKYLNEVTIKTGYICYYKTQSSTPVHWILTLKDREKLK